MTAARNPHGALSFDATPEPTALEFPPMTSFVGWEVGALPNGNSEIKFELANKDEARAWALWMLNQASSGGDLQ